MRFALRSRTLARGGAATSPWRISVWRRSPCSSCRARHFCPSSGRWRGAKDGRTARPCSELRKSRPTITSGTCSTARTLLCLLVEPAFDCVALAVLLLGAVLFDDELWRERNDLGVSRRDHGRGQHGMIALDLAVAALARLAMRAGDLLAAEILGPVEGDERSAAEPTERLAHHGFDQQLLDALEAGREQSRVRAVEHVSDVIVGRDFLNSEQGLAVRPSLAPLQRPLEGQK